MTKLAKGADDSEAELKAYAERHYYPGRSLDDLVSEWSAFWEKEHGERPDAERTECFRWHVKACRRVLEQLNRRYH